MTQRRFAFHPALAALLLAALALAAAPARSPQDLDAKVRAFLDQRDGRWHDLNIPSADGKILFDLIVEKGYKRALEVGTSTGHSGTWIAWALSKTNGRLITIEIDADRHGEAVQNFKAAGLADRIEARLGDAHGIVPKLVGPFDFVFLDADKEWNLQYAKDLLPKLAKGGCIAVHNIFGRGRGWTREYWDFMAARTDLETRVESGSSGGLVLSFKK
ncbi:MAG: class I SAM-dependent methyltransferase [Candidatus Aminicenantes bacterium]|nr:class I SAM-dependent methyltransferase [Candidatus Aminicenantes bacterium]